MYQSWIDDALDKGGEVFNAYVSQQEAVRQQQQQAEEEAIRIEMVLNPDNVASKLIQISKDGILDEITLIDGIKQK